MLYNSKQNLINQRDIMSKILIVAVWIEGIILLILNLILSTAYSEKNVNIIIPIIGQVIFNLLIIFISIKIDKGIISRIKKHKQLLNVEPSLCVVEDVMFLIYGHHSKHDMIKHDLILLIKETETGKLWFTYGDNNLSMFKYSAHSLGDNVKSYEIIKNDSTKLNIGDTVHLYKLQEIYPTIKINNNKITINNFCYRFRNTNQNYNIDTLKDAHVYEGAIDIG